MSGSASRNNDNLVLGRKKIEAQKERKPATGAGTSEATQDLRNKEKRIGKAANACLEAFDAVYARCKLKINAEGETFIPKQRDRFLIWHSLYSRRQKLDDNVTDILETILEQLSNKLESLLHTFDFGATFREFPAQHDYAGEACLIDSSSDSVSDDEENMSTSPLAASIDRMVSRLYRYIAVDQQSQNPQYTSVRGKKSSMHSRGEVNPGGLSYDDFISNFLREECATLVSGPLASHFSKAMHVRRADLLEVTGTKDDRFQAARLYLTYTPTQEEKARWLGLAFPDCPRNFKTTGEISCCFCRRDLVVRQTQLDPSLNELIWRWHILQDIRPFTCLVPDCKDDISLWSGITPWLEHIGSRHHSRYYCQFPGHEMISYSSAVELETHLEKKHASSVTSGMASMLAIKGKHSIPDPLIPLIVDWNRGQSERNNFIVCPFCGVRILGITGISWDAYVELKSLDIDRFRPEGDVLPTNIRGYILNHLVRHFEALALFSFWKPRPAQEETKQMPTTIPIRGILGQFLSDWIQSYEPNKSPPLAISSPYSNNYTSQTTRSTQAGGTFTQPPLTRWLNESQHDSIWDPYRVGNAQQGSSGSGGAGGASGHTGNASSPTPTRTAVTPSSLVSYQVDPTAGVVPTQPPYSAHDASLVTAQPSPPQTEIEPEQSASNADKNESETDQGLIKAGADPTETENLSEDSEL